MSKIRIGFVGVGNMGQAAHLRNYAQLDDCEVVAIAEVRPELARKVAQRYGVHRVYADHLAMLANEKLDGIVASQPFTRHGTLVPELLKAKVPIFTEKPLAGSIEAAEQVIRALDASGTWQMVGYHKRSDPATIYAKAEIDRLKGTGELGRLRYVRITMPVGDWIAGGFNALIKSDASDAAPPLAWDPPASDMDARTYDEYVAFVNYYIHQVNLLRHLLGERYRLTFADPNGLVLAATTDSGVTGVIEMNPYRTTIDWQESALAGFERGYVKLDLPAPLAHNRPGRVEVLRDPGDGKPAETVAPQLPWVHAMAQQAANFVRAIKGEAKPPCEAHEALEDLRIAREYIRMLRGK
jgi:predicted dehydrogenase